MYVVKLDLKERNNLGFIGVGMAILNLKKIEFSEVDCSYFCLNRVLWLNSTSKLKDKCVPSSVEISISIQKQTTFEK
jgi:hypothetical protein